MAKLQTDPNSATNQWFVNVKDNSGDLDSTNEGFTVFGNVLGDGMNIVDNINQLPTAPPPIGGENSRKAPFAPFISGDWSGNPQDFVYITAHVVDRFSSAVNVYEAARRLLITNVNIDDVAGRLSLTLSLIDDPEDIILEVNTDTIITVLTSPDLASTYSTSQSRLVFPQLEIHNGGGATTLCNNVVFELSDPELLRFRLVSFDPC
jgi:peptidyl-prolyl cis-trans isomerase A (cyclophilin A)